MSKIKLMLISILLLPIALAAEDNDRPTVSPTEKHFNELPWAGDAAFKAKNYTKAVELYEEASQVKFHASPNYEFLVKLAAAYCKRGRTAIGSKLLDDFSCMLDVQEGLVACFGKAEIGFLGEGNDALSDLCFETMCSEAYLGYYESQAEDMIERVRELRAEVSVARITCDSGER